MNIRSIIARIKNHKGAFYYNDLQHYTKRIREVTYNRMERKLIRDTSYDTTNII